MSDKGSVSLPSSNSKRQRNTCQRRTHKRLLCSDLVQLSWTGTDGSRHSEVVILENLSQAGVGLFTGVPLATGTTVHLALKDQTLTGRVRQCVFRQNGYILGLEISSPADGNLLPEHLLDISLLSLD